MNTVICGEQSPRMMIPGLVVNLPHSLLLLPKIQCTVKMGFELDLEPGYYAIFHISRILLQQGIHAACQIITGNQDIRITLINYTDHAITLEKNIECGSFSFHETIGINIR